MIYEITFRESRGDGVNTFTVDAQNDMEAVRLLGDCQGKNAVKQILKVASMDDRKTHAGLPHGF